MVGRAARRPDEERRRQPRRHGCQRSAPGPLSQPLPDGNRPGHHGPAVEKPLEIVGEFAGRAIAVGGNRLQALGHDRAEIGGGQGESRGIAQVASNRTLHRLERRGGLERRLAGEHREQQATDRMDVGRGADLADGGIEPGLFRGHVARRAEHILGPGQEFGGRLRPRKSEVGDLRDDGTTGIGSLGQENVGGLDVAVDDADRMHLLESPRHGTRELGSLARRQPAGRETLLERSPGDPLHDEIRHAVDLTRCMDRDHVRMAEPGQHQRLPFGPLAGRVGERRPGQQHLDGHEPTEHGISAAIDHSHPAAADSLEFHNPRDRWHCPGNGRRLGRVTGIRSAARRGLGEPVADGAGVISVRPAKPRPEMVEAPLGARRLQAGRAGGALSRVTEQAVAFGTGDGVPPEGDDVILGEAARGGWRGAHGETPLRASPCVQPRQDSGLTGRSLTDP